MATQYPLVETGSVATVDRLAGNWSDYRVSAQTVHSPAPVRPAASPPPPSILNVVFKLVLRRWKLLALWCAVTLGAIAAAIVLFGKPMWRAEAKLRHDPTFGQVQRRLGSPPNIEDMLLMMKKPEVLEQAHAELVLPGTPDALKSAVHMSIDKSTSFISVAVDNPNREQAVRIADRLMAICIGREEKVRIAELEAALKEKEDQKRDESLNRQRLMQAYNAKLRDHRVSIDIKAEIERLTKEISDQTNKLAHLESDAESLPTEIRATVSKLDTIRKESINSAQTQAIVNNLKAQLFDAERNLNADKTALAKAEREWVAFRKIVEKGAVAPLELADAEGTVRSLKLNIANNAKHADSLRNALGHPADLVDATQMAGPRDKLLTMENRLKTLVEFEIPRAKNLIQTEVDQQRLVLRVQDSLYPQIQELETKQKTIEDLDRYISENRTLLGKSAQELKIKDPASTGPNSISSNYPKLAGGVFAVMMLAFLGFVAVRDLPRYGRSGEVTARRLGLPLLAHYKEAVGTGVAPGVRALAAQLHSRFPERGSVVLFTPALPATPIEKFVGELASCAVHAAGRVLVFDARDALHGRPAAWIDGAAGAVGRRVDDYLEGRTDQPANCFAPTAIPGIEFSRADLNRHVGNMIGTYRFNRLVAEMRESYDTVYLIGPAAGNDSADDGYLASLVDGTILVLDDVQNPAGATAHVESLRHGDNPPLGAIVYEGRTGGW